MWRVFDRADHSRVIGGYRVIRFCDREFKSNVPRRFNPERERWENELASADPRKQIHLQHYVVTPRENEHYPHTYEEGEEITRRTIDSGKVVLSLSGHLHRGTPLLNYGSTTFSTGVALGESPFGWRMYEVTDSGVTMTQHELGRDAMPPGARRKVVFLDRDGVINTRDSYRTGPEDMALLPGVARAVRRINDANYAAVVISSQSCIGYGYVPKPVVVSNHDKMARLLAAESAVLDGIYFSSAAGDRAVLPADAHTRSCKPDPAMLHQAVRELNLDLEGSWMVGDRLTDIECACRAGVRPILVRTGRGSHSEIECRGRYPHALVVDDLTASVGQILRENA
jgi:D-glycero-D-manno-heptose 1,7-bisphosphate phosphatase